MVSHDARLRAVAGWVLWLEGGSFRDIASLAVDPVCGMSVEQTGPPLRWHGRSLWFCSTGCRHEFLSEPAQFSDVRPPAGTR